jgi:hypothetical protein
MDTAAAGGGGGLKPQGAGGGAQAAVLGDQQDHGNLIYSNEKEWGDRVSEADKHVLIQQTNNDGPFSRIFCDIYVNGIWLHPITDSERVGTFPFTFEPLFIPYGEIIEVKAAKQGHKLRRSGYKGMGDAMGRITYQCLTILTRNPTRLGLTDKKHQKTKIRLGFMETGLRDQWLTGINEAKAKAPVADVAERSDASAVRNDLAQNPWVKTHMRGLWYRNVYKRREYADKNGIVSELNRPEQKARKDSMKRMGFGASDKYYIRDDMAQCCLVCFDPFNTKGFFQRSGKHHCRMCGFVVCESCMRQSSLMGWPYYYDRDSFEYKRADKYATYDVCTKCITCLKANVVADPLKVTGQLVTVSQDPDSLLRLSQEGEKIFARELNRNATSFGSPIKYEWDKNKYQLDPVLFVLSLAYEDPWIGDEQITIRRYHGATRDPREFTDTRLGLIQSIIKSTDLTQPAGGGQAAAAEPQPMTPEPSGYNCNEENILCEKSTDGKGKYDTQAECDDECFL